MENRGRLPNPAAEKRQEKSEEKLGGAVMGILWIFVAVRRIAIVTVIALPILWLLHKPLWIAPVIGVVVYIIWRIIWRAFWKFIHWSQK
ncbi:MAG: hypothetical protein II760_06130 [Lachnospiraceae bacterium]|nr:hypothetical protein [Lachnospiraceae bacterium]